MVRCSLKRMVVDALSTPKTIAMIPVTIFLVKLRSTEYM